MFLKPRSGREPCPVLALADDLSGAAETAAALCLPGRIVLGPATGGSAAVAPPVAGEALVLDLDTRQLDPGEAARVVRETVRDMARATVRDAGNDTVLIKKTDSLLRGNLAAEAAAYAEGAGGLVIAPALPVAGRTVCDGVVHLHGTPLHETDAWRAEAGSVPRSVAEALGDLRTEVVPLAVVRSSGRELAGLPGTSPQRDCIPCATRRRTPTSTRSPPPRSNWALAYGSWARAGSPARSVACSAAEPVGRLRRLVRLTHRHRASPVRRTGHSSSSWAPRNPPPLRRSRN